MSRLYIPPFLFSCTFCFSLSLALSVSHSLLRVLFRALCLLPSCPVSLSLAFSLSHTQWMVLENVMSGMRQPWALDLKMGTRTFGNAQHSTHAMTTAMPVCAVHTHTHTQTHTSTDKHNYAHGWWGTYIWNMVRLFVCALIKCVGGCVSVFGVGGFTCICMISSLENCWADCLFWDIKSMHGLVLPIVIQDTQHRMLKQASHPQTPTAQLTLQSTMQQCNTPYNIYARLQPHFAHHTFNSLSTVSYIQLAISC